MPTRQLALAASDLHEQLERLERERTTAVLNGLGGNALYMGDLLDEIESTRSAYVGAAVIEIASLRSALSGPLHG